MAFLGSRFNPPRIHNPGTRLTNHGDRHQFSDLEFGHGLRGA
jgi:hypothetical protein